MKQKNIESNNQKISSGKIYLSKYQKNLLINGAIAFIPAIIATAILLEMEFPETLALELPIIIFAYLVGLIREKIKKKEEGTEKSNKIVSE